MRTFVVLLNDSVVCVVTADSVYQAERFAQQRWGSAVMVLETESHQAY